LFPLSFLALSTAAAAVVVKKLDISGHKEAQISEFYAA
jgi:hypothetical protein